MNKLICITSHCNTKDKIKTLEANISYLKNEGFNILLLSHLPLNKSILSSVDHFIYNTDNQLTSYPELFQINLSPHKVKLLKPAVCELLLRVGLYVHFQSRKSGHKE